ncbi:MAG: hypothetical protein M1819_000391 [Sarea resinae]|nr:MAG: hypothetical protein M1819_000391 [Sarea resinae]
MATRTLSRSAVALAGAAMRPTTTLMPRGGAALLRRSAQKTQLGVLGKRAFGVSAMAPTLIYAPPLDPKLTPSSSPTAAAKKYTQDHEWIDLSPETSIGTIGITSYASHSLGDIVYVELPTLPLEVSAGDSIGAVESVKSASDIMSPVSGEVVEANSVLEEKPGTINKAPEGEGWIAKVKVGDKGLAELEALMGEEEYKAFVEE